MPQISVIVPVYKVEPYLHRCIDSILSQTFTDFELILIDDGSPDNCGAICDEYVDKDSRIHVIHQKNGGLSAARNAGIDWAFEHSDSEWLTFVDSDDWVHPEYLKVLLDAAEKGNAEIAVTELYRTAQYKLMETQQPIYIFFKPKEYYLYAIKETDNMSACGKLYRKKLFVGIRYPVGRIWEDLGTTYKLLFSANIISFIDKQYQYYYYFFYEASITHAKWTKANLDELKAYEEQFIYFESKCECDEIKKALQKRYIKVIGHHVINLERAEIYDKQKKYFRTLLSRKMRRAMIVYGHSAGVTYPEYSWELEIAFPRGMQAYWVIQSQLQKIKKAFGRK